MARTHPAYASWSHRELHRRPQWHGSHAAPSPLWHTLTLFVATEGAPSRASMALFACPPLHFGTLLTRFTRVPR
eukprot:7818142-Pyramimonas_sp.AAC.1